MLLLGADGNDYGHYIQYDFFYIILAKRREESIKKLKDSSRLYVKPQEKNAILKHSHMAHAGIPFKAASLP